MAFLEKSNWVVLVVAVVTLIAYGGTVASHALSKTLYEKAGAQAAAGAAPGGADPAPDAKPGPSAPGGDDDTIDAEFEVKE